MADDALDQAANAFDTAIAGNTNAMPSEQDRGTKRDMPVESLFGDVGNLEVDDESPAEGGGDRVAALKARKQEKEVLQASEEDDDGVQNIGADEDEDEEGAENNADEEDEDEDEQKPKKDDDEDEDEFYEVTVDGEKKEVSLREALDGYIRMETFHTRLNNLNEVREALKVEGVKILENRKKYIDKLDMIDKMIDSLIPQEPDWIAEGQRDPEGAKVLRQQYEALNKQLAAIRAEKQKVVEEDQGESEAAQKEYIIRENAKILNNHKHWSDPEKRKRDLTAMAETAEAMGFSREEVMNTYDSRMIGILYKAMKYDKIQASKPKPVRRGKIKPVEPGAGSRRTAPKGLSKASSQLRRSGSVEDAGNVFAQIINPRR